MLKESGFTVQSLESRVSRVKGLGFRVYKIEGLRFRV
jgi:hypothetical protein